MQERKNLDDRAKMTELERIRHSAAHVMATAILRLWPDAQFAAGPPVETGFYYDVDLKHRISPEDFPKIEEEMKKEIKANNVFEKIVVTREQAIKDSESGRLGGLTERPGNVSKFKLGNLESIPEGELSLSGRQSALFPLGIPRENLSSPPFFVLLLPHDLCKTVRLSMTAPK